MSEKYKYSTTQLLNFTRDSYLERTSRPIYAVGFLLPFIVLYEVGTILINTDVLNQSQVRVVAFVWLQRFLEYLGTGSRLAWAAPPLVAVIILIGLQLASHKQWYLCFGDFGPMAAECVLLAVPLIVLSLFLNSPPKSHGEIGQFGSGSAVTQSQGELAAVSHLSAHSGKPSMIASRTTPGKGRSDSLVADIVTGIGAGIYEELVFRLILICILMLLLQDILGLTRQNAIVLSILISAALFSAHHHIVLLDGRLGLGAPFGWTEFGFRTAAGIYFAVLFAFRGFGITAGTHAFYDIIATIINAVFFKQ